MCFVKLREIYGNYVKLHFILTLQFSHFVQFWDKFDLSCFFHNIKIYFHVKEKVKFSKYISIFVGKPISILGNIRGMYGKYIFFIKNILCNFNQFKHESTIITFQ